jgi:hypothetical protein
VLSWTPRVRTGPGAGLRPESSTDASPTWEGYFEVRVYSGETLLRTVTGIDGRTWTYTAAMRADDGAGDVDLTFKLRNYLTTGGAAYASDWEEITVRYNTAAGPDYTALTTQAGEELMTEAGEFLITEE